MSITTLQEITLLVKNKTLVRNELLDLILNSNSPSVSDSSSISSHVQIIDFKVHDGQNLATGDSSAILAFDEKTIVQVVGEKYNLVVLLDCTDSMKTTESKVLASIAFETICKFMEGLACPFVINHSFTSKATLIEPNVNVSVIGVGKRVKTFLYNQPVCKKNMMELAEILYMAIIKFENESIADAKSDDSTTEAVANQDDFFITPSLGNGIQTNSSTKELGLLPNEVSMLDLGVSFLDLMKREGALPVMVLVTDGVSLDLHLSSDETNRTIIRELINVCVVQTGSGQGYSPNSNFGHIPNNEDLRFLSLRADGPFIYADDCPYVLEENESSLDPNFFHHIAATRKFSFSNFGDSPYLIGCKPRPVDQIRSRFINTAVLSPSRHTTAEQSKELSFPWLPESKSPYIAEILCSYRSYKLLNIAVDTLLRMRTNEGFVLGINRTKSQTRKMQRLEMTFILPLAPHVKIMYTIKFAVPNPSSTRLTGYVPPKGIRVDVNVLAHHSFAILFINLHNLESSKTDSISGALYNKLVHLHSTLKGVSEADETLQILFQFNSASALYLASQMSGSAQHSAPPTMELPSNYWNFLNQAVLVKPWLLDSYKIVILLRSTSTQSNMGARALASLQPSISTESPRTRYQVSTIYLSRLLTSWASFSLSKTSYVAWVFENCPDASNPTGFCLLQVTWETESLMSLNLRFFSVSAQERHRIGLAFEKDVSGLYHVNRHNPDVQIKPLSVCQKPLDSILISYESIESSAKNAFGNNVSDYFTSNKSLARSFLNRKSWVWFRDINQSSFPEGLFSHLIESSFILLYNTRISEGFSRAAESPGIVTFYKEIEIEGVICAMQYILLYDGSSDYLASEIWMEPTIVGYSVEKRNELEKRIVGSIFNKDRDLLMGIYQFNLRSNDPSSFSAGVKCESMHELVPTVLHIPSFFCFRSNSISFLRFALAGCSEEERSISSVSPELSIPFKYFNHSVPLSQALSIPSNTSNLLHSSLLPNETLLFFFSSALSKAASCEFLIPPSKSSTDLDAGLSEVLKVVPPLENSHLFYFPINSETLFVFALTRKIPDNACGYFLSSLYEVKRPILDEKVPEAANYVKFVSVESDTDVDDASEVFKMVETAQARGNTVAADGFSASYRFEAIKKIGHCFKQSLGKLIYLSAIRGDSISSSDLARGLNGFKREAFLLDITNFVFLSAKLPSADNDAHFRQQVVYQSMLDAGFDSVASLVCGQHTLPHNLFFHRPKPEELKDDTSLIQEPLFISIYALKSNGETLDCSTGLPDATGLFASEAKNPNLFVPLDASNPKLELAFEVFTFEGMKDISLSKVQAFNYLKKRISVLLDDQVIKILLALPVEDFPLSTVSYIESLFLERLSDVIMPATIEEAASLDQNLISFRSDLALLNAECSKFVREDLPSFSCLESPIRQCNEFYYSSDKRSGASFWITFTLFDNEVEFHLYCDSRDIELRTAILTSARDSIHKCAQRANQRFLLRELVETHLARECIDPKYACFQSSRYDDVLFQLGCDERHSQFIPMHWRLRPALALNSIMSSLQALAVVNRKNCLIYSDGFYMLFMASPEDEKSISRTELMDTPNRGKDKEAIFLNDSVSNKTTNWGITLRVFGIEAPTLDIINDFSKMIEAKIDALTQQTLAAFIARNPAAKLSRSDFEFLMPSSKQPSYSSTFLLVKEMENPHLFLVLLRQALLLFLLPCVGGEICSVLSSFYQKQYGKTVTEEKDSTLLNVLNLGNLSFLYNCVSRRQLTQLESKVGFGTACVSLAPFDKDNNILFPSKASSSLGTKYAVELDNSKFQVKQCDDVDSIRDWPGYKVTVSIWSKGTIHLEALLERIEMAFKYTLVDYAIESYYRSSKWYSLSGRKRLPDLIVEQPAIVDGATGIPSSSYPRDLASEMSLDSHPNHVLSILPEVLQTGARRMNPVLQSITISSSLPLDTIALGLRTVLVDENLQALFFVKKGTEKQFSLLERMLKPSEKGSGEYVIIGAADIFTDPLDLRKSSNASDLTSPLGSPRILGRSTLPRKGSVDSFPSESEPDDSKERISQRLSDELEEVFMFPDLFYPPFPVYGKRSSFFIVCLSGELIHVSTYNWKKNESDKFFLKVTKILNWAKINSQFMIRKAWYSQAQVTKLNAVVSGFGEKAHGSTWGNGKTSKLNFTVTFASKFRELDFIYHIGGYDATQLQTQIVDYLELFFKFGSRKGNFSLKEQQAIPPSRSSAPLSLQEMSKVLTSLSLVHSSSSPIFFSDCCSDLLVKWQRLIETQSINSESLLSLGKSIITNPTTSRKVELGGEEMWFKEMIDHFGDCYVSYLESLGMTKSNINLKNQDSNRFGGAFAMNSKILLHVPSIFMEKVFNSGVILVQIGFYAYFACVNVLSFDYSAASANTSSTTFSPAVPDCDGERANFDEECQKMKSHTHIVSFLYDFHLRYIQDVLDRGEGAKSHDIDLIKVLRHFVALNPRKARFARNRIIHGYHDWNQESSDLFRYIVKNPSHSFLPILYQDISIAIFVTTNHLSRKEKSPLPSSSSNLKYTLVLCEELEGDFKRLEYFILVVDQSHPFPHGEMDDIPELLSQLDVDPLKEYMEGGYYLSDVLKSFEKVIENLIEKGLKDFGRDNLWVQLRDDPNYSAEWTSLFLEKIAPQMRDISSQEGPLQFMLSCRLPWKDIFAYLATLFKKQVRLLNNSADESRTHLIIFNPKNHAFFLYFRLHLLPDGLNHVLKVFAVSREGLRDPIEYYHLSEVVEAILHWLWHDL